MINSSMKSLHISAEAEATWSHAGILVAFYDSECWSAVKDNQRRLMIEENEIKGLPEK